MTMDNITILIEAVPVQLAEHSLIRDQMKASIENEMDVEFIDDLGKENAKGSPLDWNTILIGLVASGGVLTTLIGLLQAQLGKLRQITVEIDGDKLTLTNATSEQQDLILQNWIRRHSDIQKKPYRRG